jgi:hypothetical protein
MDGPNWRYQRKEQDRHESIGHSSPPATADIAHAVNDRLNLPPERSFESPPVHMLSFYGFPGAVPASLP